MVVKCKICKKKEKHCNNKGNITKSNVTKEESKAIKSLSDKVRNRDVIILATDKSGKLACETIDTYTASMEPHVNKDAVIDLDKRKDVENSLNGHCLQLGRIVKIGYTHGHWDRMKSALINKFGHVPVLYGLKKDQKVSFTGKPTPTRPVCGANDAPYEK